VSLHDDALATLRGWRAPDAGQERLRREYVAHLEAHPDGTRRSCFPDHLTAGTVVLSADGGSVLLNLHRKARRWFAFGGHIEDGDARLADAALREAQEESGVAGLRFDDVPLHLDRHAVGFCDPRGEVRHLDVRYGAVAPEGAGHAASDESLDVRWWPLDGLPELEDEMHTLIGRARDRLFGRRVG
jgi:8-oxo-dGTP pyrophosphatase MutT (NUDIX family)